MQFCSPIVTLFPVQKTGRWSNLHACQWKLSQHCNLCSTDPPFELTLSISFLSNGLQPELSSDLWAPSALPFLSAPSHCSLSLFVRGQLNSRDGGDGALLVRVIGKTPSAPGPRCESEVRPSPLISADFPVSNKSFSQQAQPLWLRQSRISTLSAADIKASFAVKH